jgi:hypothetical protein
MQILQGIVRRFSLRIGHFGRLLRCAAYDALACMLYIFLTHNLSSPHYNISIKEDYFRVLCMYPTIVSISEFQED